MARTELVVLGMVASALSARLTSSNFHVELDSVTGAIVELTDPTQSSKSTMNWVSGPANAPWQPSGSRWGLGYADLGADLLHRSVWINPEISQEEINKLVSTYILGPLKLTVSRTVEDDALTEQYVFTNRGNETVNLSSRGPAALGIYTPFNDHYTNTTDAMSNRAHAHIWANGGSSAWVKMDQMGGQGRNLGLVLTKGALSGYSVESRDPVTLSNTRGVFLLNPNITNLEPGQSETVEWKFFWHSDWPDFFSKCADHSKQFINFEVAKYTLVEGEEVAVKMTGAVNSGTTINGESVACDGSECTFIHKAGDLGRHKLDIVGPAGDSSIFINTVPAFDDVISNRTTYIVEKQQLPDEGNATDGAYVVFDTQAQIPAFWETRSDTSVGRERLGMGILMSRWLKKHPQDAQVHQSLKRWYTFASLNLQDDDGYVLNRPGPTEDDSQRLYNWPWMLQLHISVAAAYLQGHLELDGPVSDKSPLERFMLTLENFYSEGGAELYAIGLPILETLRFLNDTGEEDYFKRALELFQAHGDVILERGLNYPPFEVNFEQSIVAPAAVMMLELYRFTGNETWLEGAEIQMETLLRFEGKQPDSRLHEIAIRHWDGYWFGKERHWGDTFPHHWSTLDAVALHHYGRAIDDRESVGRADRIIRGNLELFSPDGSAGCAWIYPLTVNGREAHKRDFYANDQDWVLNHLLYLEEDTAYDA